MPQHKKGYSTAHVIDKQNPDGSTKFRLTERKVDRDGDVVEPAGGDLSNYIKNPIVLFAHGFSRPQGNIPIGRIAAESIKQTKRHIDGNVFFHEEGADPFSSMIAEKVHGGFLNTGSIGFLPQTVGREPVMNGQTGVVFQEWELLEFSIVPIPSNSNATARREFDQFAYKCADYGMPLDDDFIDAVDKNMGIHGGVLKALSDSSHVTRTQPAGTIDALIEALDKQGVDIAAIKAAVPALADPNRFAEDIIKHEPTGDDASDMLEAIKLDEGLAEVMLRSMAMDLQRKIHRAHV